MTVNNQTRVFVVDDERAVADSLSALLRYAGFKVQTFYDALPAINQAIGTKPDVIVTDYRMPTSGLRLASWLRDYCPDCKVVLITGDASTCNTDQADHGYRFTLLEKPVDPVTLIDVVSKVAAHAKDSGALQGQGQSQPASE